jgi:hypothetical protein
MKTPREILLTRHQSANPKLDDRRTTALSIVFSKAPGTARNGPMEGLLPVRAALAVWRELIWPCRRAWAGMAALWVVMWGINCGLSGTQKAASRAPSASATALVEALEEQRRLLAELIPPASSQPAEPPRRNPQRRSDRQPENFTV